MIVKDRTSNKYIIIENTDNIKNYYFNIVYKKYGINLNQSNINYIDIIKTKISKYYNK